MDNYKNILTLKYIGANSYSKRKAIADELIMFSNLYKDLLGEDCKFDWDEDLKIYDTRDQLYLIEFEKFVEDVNEKKDFYYKLSKSVINSFNNIHYPFYKYFDSAILNSPRLDNNTMLKLILSFLKNFDYDTYLDMKDKMKNLEVLQFEFDSCFGGLTFPISSLNKNFILLNTLFDDNVYKYSVIAHEYGHTFEMKMFQNSDNNMLIEKGGETPYTEVSSCFFEYAFLNYLKESKIYTDYVNCCLDNYFKEMLNDFFEINLISKFPDLEIDEDENITIESKEIVNYGEKIKNKLNYYNFSEYETPISFKSPYIYGIGKLFSIYLYEKYKENSDFLTEFKKSLSLYPIVNDISVFNNVGINEENLLNGDILKKVLKKHSHDFRKK